MRRLTRSISEATGLTDIYPVAPVGDPPSEHRAPKRLDPRKGDRFTPHSTDSVGVVISDPRRNRRTVQFRYDHATDVVHSLPAHEFTDRFAWIIPRIKLRAVDIGDASPATVVRAA